MKKVTEGHLQELLDQIKQKPLPRHVAIIMDGNGRWARSRNLPRVEGHRAGITSVREVVEGSAELGIDYLTLFAFSTENWKRPESEISVLMSLLKRYIDKELPTLIEKNINFSAIGRMENLHESVRKKLNQAKEKTAHCTGLHFIVALNYSGRAELVDAVKKILLSAKQIPVDIDSVTEGFLQQHLYTSSIPDPDLLIRTSGEYRISNFMLWQLAYSEIWITELFWPDFNKRCLYEAILVYQKRERRYGGLSEKI
ncbi:MAG: di-trans,poly-cis-decaprenylcistransferase [Candidatus Fischerbacteria bacterium RBG_13_37_8]|uniref:Isoprenyl transferase n=1 Tax=Candidatus Fischerbacteria bacterium RBG_13_37_8 TaxID=1817863 RepID=A0A1F5VTI2_9BACT|nr:MAG: di-trans,poly-cis-decaprenylcistransferase [Candidatus Fischerbacteria bacterium RBG_13_37_8]